MAWAIRESRDVAKAKEEFGKKYKEETNAVIANLATLLRALEMGTKVEQIKSLGFVHGNYDLDVLSIDESGHGKSTKPKALRLYVWASVSEKVLYVILLSDKSSKAKQQADVKLCKESIEPIIKDLKNKSAG